MKVLAFNGKPVKNLKSLASMVKNCDEEFLKFDLEYQQIVILQTETAKAATLDILKTYCIPSAMSDDLMTWSSSTSKGAELFPHVFGSSHL